ncbi:MAG: hypothetical protein AAGI11_06365 [Pseudomonadota bacterium]
MGASRKTIAMPTERVQQAQQLAKIDQIPLTDYLEKMIARDARKRKVKLPGLIAAFSIETGHVLLCFKMSNTGESTPLIHLADLEAKYLSGYLRSASKNRGQPETRPITTEFDGKILHVSKQAKAVKLEVFTKDGKKYIKTLSPSMANEVADWLDAARKAAMDHDG